MNFINLLINTDAEVYLSVGAIVFMVIALLVYIVGLVLAILAIIDGNKINNQAKLILGIIGIFIPICGIVGYCLDLGKVKKFKAEQKLSLNNTHNSWNN